VRRKLYRLLSIAVLRNLFVTHNAALQRFAPKAGYYFAEKGYNLKVCI